VLSNEACACVLACVHACMHACLLACLVTANFQMLPQVGQAGMQPPAKRRKVEQPPHTESEEDDDFAESEDDCSRASAAPSRTTAASEEQQADDDVCIMCDTPSSAACPVKSDRKIKWTHYDPKTGRATGGWCSVCRNVHHCSFRHRGKRANVGKLRKNPKFKNEFLSARDIWLQKRRRFLLVGAFSCWVPWALQCILFYCVVWAFTAYVLIADLQGFFRFC
jgi:hypothetical protein